MISRLNFMQRELLERAGGLSGPYVPNKDRVTVHFFNCSHEEAIDFIEIWLENPWNSGGDEAVFAINTILDEEGIGFGFTHWRETPEGGAAPPHPIHKGELRMHAEVVKPCLAALTDPRFKTADDELRQAFEAMRQRKYPDAITHCGSAFESVLKTICDARGWPLKPDRDTLGRLLSTCCDNSCLFRDFYLEALKGAAEIRNNISSSHGKAQSRHSPSTREEAEHMINIVCSDILLAIQRAGL
jgi:hypothetical protein